MESWNTHTHTHVYIPQQTTYKVYMAKKKKKTLYIQPYGYLCKNSKKGNEHMNTDLFYVKSK